MSEERFDALLRAASDRLAGESRGPCPPAERWLELYAGRLGEADAEALREHLALCSDCLELARDARRWAVAPESPSLAPLAAPRAPGGAARPAASARLAPLARLAAALLLVAGLAWLVVARGGRPPTEPIAKAAWQAGPAGLTETGELLYRDAEAVDPGLETSFAAAMAPYARDDFAAAERDLARHLATHPLDQRARFYRGVSLLLLGRDREAEPLLAGVEAMASPRLAESARWYRALALLRRGDRAGARAELATLANGGGAHRADAARRLAELDAEGRR